MHINDLLSAIRSGKYDNDFEAIKKAMEGRSGAKTSSPSSGLRKGAIVTSDVYRSEGDIKLIGDQQPANKDHISPWFKALTDGGRTFELEVRFINGTKGFYEAVNNTLKDT